MILSLIPFLLIGASGGWLFLNWSRLPPEVPWFYSLPWGEDQLIAKNWFVLGLGILVLVNLVNIFLATIFTKTDKVVERVIRGASLLITGLYLISFLRVLTILI